MKTDCRFSREKIKFYEFLWVIMGAVVAAALYDVSKPDRDAKWYFLLLGSGWASVCSFNIYRTLDEKWQEALRNFNNALKVYDKELADADFLKELRVWFWAGSLAAIAALVACFIL